MVKKIKNNDTVEHIWCGKVIQPSEYYEIQPFEESLFTCNSDLLAAIDAGTAVVSNGVIDYSNAARGKAYLQLSSPGMIVVPLIGNALSYLLVSELTYTCKASLVWPGFNKVGIPDTIKMVATIEGGISPLNLGWIRVRDVTNNTTIAAKTSFESLSDGPFSLGDLDNVTAGDATWEIQAKVSGLAILKLKSLSIIW